MGAHRLTAFPSLCHMDTMCFVVVVFPHPGPQNGRLLPLGQHLPICRSDGSASVGNHTLQLKAIWCALMLCCKGSLASQPPGMPLGHIQHVQDTKSTGTSPVQTTSRLSELKWSYCWCHGDAVWIAGDSLLTWSSVVDWYRRRSIRMQRTAEHPLSQT